MTDDLPLQPALLHMRSEAAMFSRLSEFQAQVAQVKPVPPQLPAVLAAALPAFEAGFSYTSCHWRGELTVTLHFQGAELGSSATAEITGYCATTARLLAGLLGIPLDELASSAEAELVALEPAAEHPVPTLELVPEPEQEAVAIVSVEDADQAPDPLRLLTEEERTTAIDMVKAMPVDVRKAFTRAFRDEFDVPPEAKQVSPYIRELRHMQFCDRFTVEAAGGIAA